MKGRRFCFKNEKARREEEEEKKDVVYTGRWNKQGHPVHIRQKRKRERERKKRRV